MDWQSFAKYLDPMCRQGRLEEARRSLAWLREGECYLEEEHEILEVDTFLSISLWRNKLGSAYQYLGTPWRKNPKQCLNMNYNFSTKGRMSSQKFFGF